MDIFKLALLLAQIAQKLLQWWSEQQTRTDEDRKIAADAQKDIADAISKANAARAAVAAAAAANPGGLRDMDTKDRRD